MSNHDCIVVTQLSYPHISFYAAIAIVLNYTILFIQSILISCHNFNQLITYSSTCVIHSVIHNQPFDSYSYLMSLVILSLCYSPI